MPRPAATPPRTPHADRLKRLRARMRREDIDHLLVTNPVDVGYLTGFLGGDSYLLVGAGKPRLFSDRRYEEDLQAFAAVATPVMRDGPMSDLVASTVAGLSHAGRLERLGVQAEHMSLAQADGLRRAFRKARAPARAITPTAGLVSGLRRTKDAGEAGLIRRAARIQQRALAEVLPRIRPGVTEARVAGMLEHAMRDLGSSKPPFEVIVAAGASSSRPHARAGAGRVRAGQPLLIDWGATVEGYASDMTRTFTLGRWPAAMRGVHEVVLEAHLSAAAALRPGARCVDVDAAARAVIDGAGHAGRFAHGLGHGLGMNVHEAPSLSRHAGEDTLREGDVVTVEPGVYIPGVGGVRIEDDYLITARGAENLCDAGRSSIAKDSASAVL